MATFVKLENRHDYSSAYINIDSIATLEEDCVTYKDGIEECYTIISFVDGGVHKVEGNLEAVIKLINAAKTRERL